MTRILSVSSDRTLLQTREMLLRECGYEVTSALGASEAIKYVGAKFDLLIIGHSMPHEQKRALIRAFRAHNNSPVLALHRENEEMLEDVDFEIPPDPQVVVSAVASLIASRGTCAS